MPAKKVTPVKKATKSSVKTKALAKKQEESVEKIVLEGKVSKPKKAKEEDKELQANIKGFINRALPGMMDDFENLSPSKRWDVLVQLLPYVTPKMQTTDVGVNIEIESLASQLGSLATEIDEQD